MPEKIQIFMYALMKEARRSSLVEFLEHWGISEQDFDEIEAWFDKEFGIKL
ncbi:hypothetical protein [Bacillus sonorensis]|uniref:hypothetical protein n=1 Tax=Bacillus sonorensis TaxID=119858 RepID=UPI0015C3DC18|nr:hypothetical protein [Bacillus sonorensis]